MIFLNEYAEQVVLAGDDKRRVLYPKLSTSFMRTSIDDAHKRGLTIIAIVLYNCATSYVYDWRRTLQSKYWLGQKMTMTRRAGEYTGTQDAILLPARIREYSIPELRQMFLGGGE